MKKYTKHDIIRTVGYIPVILTFTLLFWSFYAFIIVYCFKVLPKINISIILSIFLTIGFIPIFILTVWSYYQSVFTTPLTPESVWNGVKNNLLYLKNNPSEITEASEPLFSELKIIEVEELRLKHIQIYPGDESLTFPMVTMKQTGERRFCQKCNFEKPDRSHHCSICGKCILKMDHHCPWLNNCVGFHNYKYFLLFIFYTTIFTLFVFISTLPGVLDYFSNTGLIYLEEFQLIFLILISGLFGLALLGFSIIHILLIIKNRSTIEDMQKAQIKYSNGLIDGTKFNLFDLGNRRNIIEIFGPFSYKWFLPIPTTPGDGVNFPLNAENYYLISNSEESV